MELERPELINSQKMLQYYILMIYFVWVDELTLSVHALAVNETVGR